MRDIIFVDNGRVSYSNPARQVTLRCAHDLSILKLLQDDILDVVV